MNEQSILRSPFNIETHKITFINYLEIVILEDGTVMYAVPSHQEKLISLACEKLNVTREELNELCPKEYYFDFMTWLCKISGCVALWNSHRIGTANEQQLETIKQLAEEELYHGY
jgi:hypothetical protein